jgi:NADH-quinone oxidoreductase subunit C
VPDRDALEQIASELGEAVIETTVAPRRDEIWIRPETTKEVLAKLKQRGYGFLASLHGLDYYPHEPRLGVIYELLDMDSVDRITIKARVSTDDPHIATVTDLWPGADFPEREVYDMFGVIFDGHPDLRRILMPEDYEGHPQRRDFPVGGEPVLFTYNESSYGKNQ